MPKILIIDDEPMIRERLAQLLSLDGFSTLTAGNGADGLCAFEGQRPEVAIVDIKMPGLSGIDVLKTMREKEADAEVIMITGHGGQDTIIQALNEGAFGYVQKPIEYDELVIIIKKALEKIDLRRRLKEYVVHLESAIAEKSHELALRIQAEKALQEKIEQAKEYQKKLISIAPARIYNMRFHCGYIPYDQVGGDIVNVIKLDDQTVLFYLADIVGHGVAAAILSTYIKVHLDQWIKQDRLKSPLEIIRRLQEVLTKQKITDENMLVIFVGSLDTESLRLTYVNAGQFKPLLASPSEPDAENACRELPATSNPLSDLLEDAVPREGSCFLEDQCKLLVFSDGLIERLDENNRIIGTKGLYRYFQDHPLAPSTVVRFINQYSLKDQNDDISYILLEINHSFFQEDHYGLAQTDRALAEAEEELANRYPETPGLNRVRQCYYELLSNAVEHGNKNNPDKKIRVDFGFNKKSIVVKVRDEGDGFDWSAIKTRRPDPASLRGRGLFLVRNFSERMTFNGKGNEITAEIPLNAGGPG